MRPSSSGLAQWMLSVALALGFGGCASLPGILTHTPDLAEPPPPVTARAEIADAADPSREAIAAAGAPDSDTGSPESILAAAADAGVIAQQTAPSQPPPPDLPMEEYDPWEPFNEVMFEFNRTLDRYVIKPVAKVYRKVMPDLLQEMIGNGFDNIAVVPRLVNSLLQGKFGGAGRELSRFLLNSTLGIGGFFDIAKSEFNIQKSKEDFGQTLGVWGARPGPYLILPFLPPLTVRDGIGFVLDGAMDPLNYVLPFIWDRFGMKVGDTFNDRAVNLDLYQGFEETTVELYSGLRNAYLQRRQKLIQE